MPSGPNYIDANGFLRPGEDAPFSPISDWLDPFIEQFSDDADSKDGRLDLLEAGSLYPRQYDASNSTPRVRVQHGIGRITGTASATLTEAVTFPTPFAAGQVPIVLVNAAGYRNVSSFNALGLTPSTIAVATHSGVSLTGFTVQLRAFTGTFAATEDWYYTWMALGVI